MFKFTTTTVINSYQDLTTGLPLWSLLTKTPVDGGDPVTTLNIKRVHNFVKDNVMAIYKSVGHDGKPAKATLDFSTVEGKKGDAYRLSIYIRLAQSCQSSYYSNDMVFKGKPLSVEFNWMDEGAGTVKTVKKLVDIINKYEIAVYEKPILKFKANGSVLEINATDEYQRLYTVKLEKYEPEAYHGMGEYTPVIELVEKPADYTEEKYPELDFSAGEIEQGIEGFGTYSWMLHNLRLPTTMRTRVFATNADETPHAGAKYNQYVIQYCTNRGILGLNAVGQAVKSITTHVLYVNQDLLGKAPEGSTETLDENLSIQLLDIEAALTLLAPNGLEVVRPKSLPEDLDA